MQRVNSLLSAGVTLTSTGTAVASPIPFDSAGYFPRFVRVVASGAGCYVKVGDIGVTAVAGDCMVQPLDGVVLNVAGCKAISAISVTGTSSVTVVPLERGSWNYDQRTLDYNFTTLSAVPSPVTFTRASNATYFNSSGVLTTASNNVARLDYDPATPAGVTGGELNAVGTSSALTTYFDVIQPTSGIVSLNSGALRIYTADGTIAQAQDKTAAFTTSLTTGKTYKLSFTLTKVSGNCLVLDGSGATAATLTTSGDYTVNLTKTGAYLYLIKRQSGVTDFTVSNISVQEVTFAPRGLLVEEQRVNYLLSSRDLRSAAAGNPITAWTNTDTTVARNQVGIDGVANSACLVTEGSAGTAYTLQNSAAVTAGSIVTASIVIKRGNTDWVRVAVGETTSANITRAWFNLATGVKGTVAAAGAATAAASTITNMGGGWYRCSVTCLPDGTYTVPQIGFVAATADNSTTRVSGATYIVDCAQLEAGSFPTSYIPTTTASATRSADSVSMTGTNFSSWYNQTQGTFVVETDNSSITTSSLIRVISVDSGSTADVLEILRDTTTSNDIRGILTLNSVSQYDTAGNATDGSFILGRNKLALSVSAGLTADRMTGNGVAVYSPSAKTTDPATRTMTTLFIGNRRALDRAMNGYIRRIQYFPVALPSATLQTLTA